MWSDTLLTLERNHLVRLSAWAVGSVLAGSLLLVWITVRRRTVPLLAHFAYQMTAWGAVELVIAAMSLRGLVQRDYAGALHLQNLLWLNIGLDAGYAGIGLTLAITSYRAGARLGGVGAGIGIIVQGLALFLLDARLLNSVGPVH